MTPQRTLLPDWARDRGVILGVLTVLLVATLDAVSQVQLTGGYATGAIVASMLSASRRTAGVGVFSIAVALLGGIWGGNIGTREWLVRALLCVILAALATTSAVIRDRREARLRRITVIAEAAQRAVLRATPTEIGHVGFASRYVSASADALVGGDLYEIAATPFGVRVIVGDVRGKGMQAVQTAASVLGAFRQAAFTEPDPAALARAVDDVVARLIDEEEFVTAIFAEFRGDTVAIANCGHHPPLVLSGNEARLLDTGEPTTPIGLDPHPVLVRHPWPPPSRMLFYTDGLVETRNADGAFFRLEAIVPDLARLPLDDALEQTLVRLRAFAGNRLTDDVALVLAENRSH
ncbi:MAG: Stage sporulation family protein [Nocardioides sp.]|nr:Stage sporulation family protein [Nocardioides sp.]